MSSLLYTLGRWAFGARKLVLILWIAVLALAGGGALLFNQGTDNAFSIPGTESQNALDRLDARAAQCALRRLPEVEDAAAREIAVEALGDLGPDLVAAGPDRGADARR